MLANPGVDMLGGGGAPLESGPHPAFARHNGRDRLIVGEQNTRTIGKGHLGLVAADLLDFHGGRLN